MIFQIKTTLVFLISAFLISGCSNRNIHKNDVALLNKEAPVLSRGIVYSTRSEMTESGQNPVEYGSPLVTKNTLYVLSETNGVEALERPFLKKKWNFNVKNGISSEPLFVDNVLYFGALDGFFYALDAEFGKVLWRFETKVPVYSKPTLVNGRVLFNTSDDIVYCLESSSGKWLWHYKRGGSYITTVRGNSTPIVHEGSVYVGFSDGYIANLQLKDGNIRWETKIHKGSKFTDVDSSALVFEDFIYIPSYDGQLYCLQKSSGKVLWNVDVGGSKRILLDEGTLFVASSFGAIYSIHAKSGKILWKFDLDEGTPTNLTFKKNFIAFGSSTQYFYVIHKGDGSLVYRFDVGLRSGFMSTPTQYDKDLFVLSNFGNVYQFRWNL